MFYQFSLPEWLVPYFGLPPVRASSIGLTGAEMVFPCMRCLPMGWSHSPYLAQVGHQNMIQLFTSIPHSSLVMPGHDHYINRTRLAVYIDDVTFIGHSKEDVQAQVDDYIHGMNIAHMPVSMDKIIPPSEDGVESIGMLIDGRARRICLHPSKASKLLRDTQALIRSGYCTRLSLQSIVGRWTWPMLIRRPSLSIFSSVYSWIQRASHRAAPLPVQVIRELTAACGFSRYCMRISLLHSPPSLSVQMLLLLGRVFLISHLIFLLWNVYRRMPSPIWIYIILILFNPLVYFNSHRRI